MQCCNDATGVLAKILSHWMKSCLHLFLMYLAFHLQCLPLRLIQTILSDLWLSPRPLVSVFTFNSIQQLKCHSKVCTSQPVWPESWSTSGLWLTHVHCTCSMGHVWPHCTKLIQSFSVFSFKKPWIIIIFH